MLSLPLRVMTASKILTLIKENSHYKGSACSTRVTVPMKTSASTVQSDA